MKLYILQTQIEGFVFFYGGKIKFENVTSTVPNTLYLLVLQTSVLYKKLWPGQLGNSILNTSESGLAKTPLHTSFSESTLTPNRRAPGLRPPGSAPARSSDPPCCPPGTPPGSGGRRGSCPSGRRSCPPSSAACSHLRPPAADPATPTSQHQRFNHSSNPTSFTNKRVFEKFDKSL